eukprot:m.43700 g.43700  ORF g.43700 m.43700 type:complete len:86 (+) comp46796_c0_seq1:177-434(+)
MPSTAPACRALCSATRIGLKPSSTCPECSTAFAPCLMVPASRPARQPFPASAFAAAALPAVQLPESALRRLMGVEPLHLARVVLK